MTIPSRQRRTVGMLVAVALLIGAPVLLRADEETKTEEFPGQAALSEALQIKVSADSIADLTKVVQLCETALKEGLSEANTQFCRQLLAATLHQRGSIVAEAIFSKVPPDPRWPEFRKFSLGDLERSLELVPNEPDALLDVARLNFLPGGDKSRAQEAVDKAIELADDNRKLLAQAYVLRSRTHEDQEDRLADLDAALEAIPGDVNVLRARGALLADMGNYEESLEDLKEVLRSDPENLPTLQLLALVLQKMGRVDDALRVLDEAIEVAPDSIALLIDKARTLALADRGDEAIVVLDEADEKDPGNVSVLVLRASIYEQEGNLDKALDDVSRVLRLAPDFPLARRLRIAMLAEKGRYDEALADLEKLQALLEKAGETDIAVTLQFALIHSAMKNYQAAVEAFDQALAEDPENIVALRGRADVYLGLGKQRQAAADYEHVLKLAPEDTGVLNNLSWLLSTSPNAELRNGRRALVLAKEAAKLTDYEQAHILSTLAAAHAELGDFEKAREWSRKAVEKAEADPDATEEMREALRKELESYKENKPWREAIPPTYQPEQDNGKSEADAAEDEASGTRPGDADADAGAPNEAAVP